LGWTTLVRLLTEKNLPLLVAAAADKPNGSSAGEQQPMAEEPVKVHQSSSPSALQPCVKQLESVESGGAVAVLEEEAARKLGLATADDQTSGALTVNAPLAIRCVEDACQLVGAGGQGRV